MFVFIVSDLSDSFPTVDSSDDEGNSNSFSGTITPNMTGDILAGPSLKPQLFDRHISI